MEAGSGRNSSSGKVGVCGRIKGAGTWKGEFGEVVWKGERLGMGPGARPKSLKC